MRYKAMTRVLLCLKKNSGSPLAFSTNRFCGAFFGKRYILQQKCLNRQIVWNRTYCLLGTRWYNFLPCTCTTSMSHDAQGHIQTRRTDCKTTGLAHANSRSYCVAVRSAKYRNTNKWRQQHKTATAWCYSVCQRPKRYFYYRPRFE